ncbi:hypothetical protein B484DRAFT_395446 [Ochromonadaceae sp. CCMP2298]|nr:hypothetical protein B484DRAFT_395446 [Ochromonadaceae sp. CCMP2298]
MFDEGLFEMEIDAGMEALTLHNPGLLHFDLDSLEITDKTLLAIATHCRYLQDLLLYYDPVFSDPSPDFADPDDEPPSISDAGIIAITQNCHLRVLHISNHRLFTDAVLMAVAAHCHDTLYLYTDCLSEFTDARLAAVVRGCPELQHVSVTGIKAITHQGIIDLAEQLPKLRNLCCNKGICDAVSDLFRRRWPAVELTTYSPYWASVADAFVID